jgi:hypothetical protein
MATTPWNDESNTQINSGERILGRTREPKATVAP